MPDHDLVDLLREENHILQISSAFGNRPKIDEMGQSLVKFINTVYKSLEPDHFRGTIIIYLSTDDSVILSDPGKVITDLNSLLQITSGTIVIQYFQSGRLPLIWKNINTHVILNSPKAISYMYHNKKENFIANKTRIDIVNKLGTPSIYSLNYKFLIDALDKYRMDRIRYSSCLIFEGCWFDKSARLFFKSKPEETMQKSLKEYLSSSLRHVEVVREYNVGASKPVDIRVYWKKANRSALIELKWLGQSKASKNKFSTSYSNARVNDGMDQMKEYMDLNNQDTPSSIVKGFLVVIDGRRRNTKVSSTKISCVDGMHYANLEIEVKSSKRYHMTITGFEEPIRMFAEPICH